MHRGTEALTGLRGVAALWVVALHFCSGYASLPAAHLVGKGYLAVDLFFALSGFVLALNHGAPFATAAPSDLCGAFYRRRIERVYPLFLAVTLLALVQRALAGAPMPSALDLAANATMTQTWFQRDGIVGPGWSVSVEAFAYVGFPWIAAFAFRRSPTVLVAAILAAWAGLWCMVAFGAASAVEMSPDGPLDIHNGQFCPILRGLCGFLAGVCAYRLACHSRVHSALSTRGLAEGLVVAIVALAWLTDLDVLVAALFVPLIAALAHPGHAASRVLGTKLFVRLGDLSYGIYLAHMIVGPIVRDALVGTIPAGAVLAACAAASLAAGLALHELVEKPCRNLIRSWRGRTPAIRWAGTTVPDGHRTL